MNTPMHQQGSAYLQLMATEEEARRAADLQVLAEVCSHVGVGVATVQSKDRSAEAVALRATVVWLMRRQYGLSASRVGRVINRNPRRVQRLTARGENRS